jgi:hypothetical protein
MRRMRRAAIDLVRWELSLRWGCADASAAVAGYVNPLFPGAPRRSSEPVPPAPGHGPREENQADLTSEKYAWEVRASTRFG